MYIFKFCCRNVIVLSLSNYRVSSFSSQKLFKTLPVMPLFQDVPLFEGIISDLFPGVELPQPDYDVFLDALKTNIAKKQLQAVPWFIDKIIQVRN